MLDRLSRHLVEATLLLGAMAGCERKATGPAAPPQRPPAPVTVQQAVAREVPLYLEEIGKTTAFEYVTIQPQVTGQIQTIGFRDGEDLKKNQKVLFTIDPRPFEAAVAQAQANVVQKQAELDLAKQEFARVEGLVATRAVSQQEYDAKKNAVAVAEAQVNAMQAMVRTAKLNLDYCTIKSPIDGRAGQRLVDVGNIVKANDNPLLVVQRLDPIYVDFTITERDLPHVRRYMNEGTLRAEVWVPGEKAEARAGHLTFMDTGVQQGAGTVRMRATLENKDCHFWAGQFVNVRLVLKIVKDAVLVPQRSVQIGQAGPFVYVIDEKNIAALRPITQGQKQGDLVVVENGVKAGERVVTVGQMGVAPGAPVTVLPPAQPAQTTQQAKQDEGTAKL